MISGAVLRPEGARRVDARPDRGRADDRRDSDISKGAIGTANVMTATICETTDNKPANVCNNPHPGHPDPAAVVSSAVQVHNVSISSMLRSPLSTRRSAATRSVSMPCSTARRSMSALGARSTMSRVMSSVTGMISKIAARPR